MNHKNVHVCAPKRRSWIWIKYEQPLLNTWSYLCCCPSQTHSTERHLYCDHALFVLWQDTCQACRTTCQGVCALRGCGLAQRNRRLGGTHTLLSPESMSTVFAVITSGQESDSQLTLKIPRAWTQLCYLYINIKYPTLSLERVWSWASADTWCFV